MKCKEFKTKVYKLCHDNLRERLAILEKEASSLAGDLSGETKSSVGDKYETGREMINIEREKVAERIVMTKKLLGLLETTKSSSTDSVGVGNLVRSGSMWIFLAVSLGELTVEDARVFVISPASPLGKQLLGQQIGARVFFKTQEYSIDEIC